MTRPYVVRMQQETCTKNPKTWAIAPLAPSSPVRRAPAQERSLPRVWLPTVLGALLYAGCVKAGSDAHQQHESAPHFVGDRLHFSQGFASRIDLKTTPVRVGRILPQVTARAITPAENVGTSGVRSGRAPLELRVSYRESALIRPGDEAEVYVMPGRSEVFKGRVSGVSQSSGAEPPRGLLKIQLLENTRMLPPKRYVEASILASGGSEAPGPIVPQQSLTFVRGKPAVFVLDPPNQVRAVEVMPVSGAGEEVQLASGLSANDAVVTRGVFELKSEFYR